MTTRIGRVRVALLRAGWAALTVAVLVPLVVATTAFMRIRTGTCVNAEYAFAPLIITCGRRSAAGDALGWTLTAVTVGGLLLALVLGLVRALAGKSDTSERVDGGILAASTLIVVAAALAVVSTNPDSSWGTNSWIFFATTAAAIALVVCASVGAVVRAARARRRARSRAQ